MADETISAELAGHIARLAWSLADCAQSQRSYELADAAVAAFAGRAYMTILAIEAGFISRRVFSTVPDAYPVGGSKLLGESPWRSQVIEAGQLFVASTSAEIAAHFPDPNVVAELGGRCLVNVPIPGRNGRTAGLFNVAAAQPYDTTSLVVLMTVGAMLGPALAAPPRPSCSP